MRLLAACTLGAAVAAAAFAKPDDRIAVTLQAVVPPGANVSQLALERSAAIMRSRLARLGVDGTITHPNGSRRIVLHLDSSSRPAALEQAKIISRPGRLELYDLEASLLAPSIDQNQNPVPSTSMHSLLKGADKRGTGRASAAYLFSRKAKHIVGGPVFGPASRDQLATALVARYGGKQPHGTELLFVPVDAVVVSCNSQTSIVCPGLDTNPAPGASYYYLFKHTRTGAHPAPAMSRGDLKARRTREDFDPGTGAPIVTIRFTPRGDKIFQQITRLEARRGRQLAAPQHFAIVLDNKIRSWPQIDYAKYPDGINPAGSGAEIAGLGSIAEARQLAAVLTTGTLPVSFSVLR